MSDGVFVTFYLDAGDGRTEPPAHRPIAQHRCPTRPMVNDTIVIAGRSFWVYRVEMVLASNELRAYVKEG